MTSANDLKKDLFFGKSLEQKLFEGQNEKNSHHIFRGEKFSAGDQDTKQMRQKHACMRSLHALPKSRAGDWMRID